VGSTHPLQSVSVIFSLGIRQPEHDADHSSPTSAEAKNVLIGIHYLMHLHGLVLNKLSTGQLYLNFI
jgi:hypothetical protein